MIGLPGETEETVEETRRWLLKNRPDDFDICPFTPYPGSDVADHPNRYDIKIERSYKDASFYHKGLNGEYNVCVRTTALSSGRIAELRDSIETEVRAELGLQPLTKKGSV
jgi:radical SAM superfamily enzyme YgiQ (UPF0313 family)